MTKLFIILLCLPLFSGIGIAYQLTDHEIDIILTDVENKVDEELGINKYLDAMDQIVNPDKIDLEGSEIIRTVPNRYRTRGQNDGFTDFDGRPL